MGQHPVRLEIRGNLDRSRLAVLFRLPAAIPHGIWLLVWGLLCIPAAVLNWLSVALTGRTLLPAARFLAAYIRYSAHVTAWFWLVGGSYPPFSGEEGEYPVEVRIEIPERQGRLGGLLRIFLAFPALLLAGATGSFFSAPSFLLGNRNQADNVQTSTSGVLVAVGVLGWFSCLVRGQMPEGLRNLGAWMVLYSSQTLAYVLLVTDRYPDAAPFPHELAAALPGRPVGLTDTGDLRRSRLLVFFRLPLLVPHLVWLALWSVVALVAAIVAWLAALATGQVPGRLHAFLERTLRYGLHVAAFGGLAGGPFPGFVGAPGSYPVDLLPVERVRHARATVLVRVILAIPALMLASAVGQLGGTCSMLVWFLALARGRTAPSLQAATVFTLRYTAEAYAYLLLLTPTYPYSGPWQGDWPPAQPGSPEPLVSYVPARSPAAPARPAGPPRPYGGFAGRNPYGDGPAPGFEGTGTTPPAGGDAPAW